MSNVLLPFSLRGARQISTNEHLPGNNGVVFDAHFVGIIRLFYSRYMNRGNALC